MHFVKATARLLCFVFALLMPSVLTAQERYNPKALSSKLDSRYGYSQRYHDDRFEGLHSIQIAGELLSVVSYTTRNFSYTLDDSRSIIIAAPAFRAQNEIGVAGRSFGINRHYSLDMVLESGGQKTIPLREVLSPNRIYAENLGLYGYTGRAEHPDLLLPVTVGENRRALQSAAGQTPVLTLVSNVDIRSVRWSVAESSDGRCGPFGAATDVHSDGIAFFSDKAIPVPLHFNRSYALGSILCIRVEAYPLNSRDPIIKNIKILNTSN